MRRLVDVIYGTHKRGRRQVGVMLPFGKDAVTADMLGKAVTAGEGVPVIVADNVAEYLFCDVAQGMWSFADDFPSLAPPFPAWWTDWRRPTRPLFTTETDITDAEWRAEYPDEVAVLAQAKRRDDGGWRIAAITFGRLPYVPGMVVCDGASWLFDVGPAGNYEMLQPVVSPSVASYFNDPDHYLHSSATALYPWALTLSFLACKNVERETVTPPPKSQRAHRRKHGRELVSYDVLKITPLASAGNVSGGGTGNGSHHRLHIVRGHFATYTADAPLFGHFTGTVWRESHTRGHGPGRHEKRYQVNAPQSKGSA